MTDPYKVLQVDPEADLEVIKAAYRGLARKWHPDANDSPRAEERFKEIAAAYDLLIDPARRLEYDRRRKAEGEAKIRYEHERVSRQSYTSMSDYQQPFDQSPYTTQPRYAQPPWGAPSPGMTPGGVNSRPANQRRTPFSAGRSSRPWAVEISFWLWMIICICTTIEAIIDIANPNGHIHREVRSNSDLAILSVMLAIWYVCPFLVRRGRNGARMVLGFFASFILLVEWLEPISSGPIWALEVFLNFAAIMTMFLPAANVWFRHLRTNRANLN